MISRPSAFKSNSNPSCMYKMTFILLCLIYSWNIKGQTRIRPMIAGLINIRDNDYITFKNGLSPSLQLQFGKSSHLTSIKLQHIWWETSDTYVHRAQSSLFGAEQGYYKSFERFRGGVYAGLSYMWSFVQFLDIPFDLPYTSDFKWQNIGYEAGLDFIPKNNILIRLNYFAMHPSKELPFYYFVAFKEGSEWNAMSEYDWDANHNFFNEHKTSSNQDSLSASSFEKVSTKLSIFPNPSNQFLNVSSPLPIT